MALTTSTQMLLKAQKEKYAVGAFNAENMEMVKAIIRAAEKQQAPVIIQTTPSTVKYGTVETFAALVQKEAEKATVPVCLHLDHGNQFDDVMYAIKQGYTSVMIDGSQRSFDDNIELTKKVADVARAMGISCEAELGKVGGKEDDLEAESDQSTNPQEAKEFVEKTGVTSLAIAIGTAHGFYKGIPKLDIVRLKEIRNSVSIPLVLHGASGLSEEQIKECVQNGICKVNFATQLREVYTKAVREYLEKNPSTIDPKAYGKLAMEAVQNTVEFYMNICGCIGKK